MSSNCLGEPILKSDLFWDHSLITSLYYFLRSSISDSLRSSIRSSLEIHIRRSLWIPLLTHLLEDTKSTTNG